MQNLSPAAKIMLSNPAGQIEHFAVRQRFSVEHRFNRLKPATLSHLRRELSVHPDAKTRREPISSSERNLDALSRPNQFPQAIWNLIVIHLFHRAVENHTCVRTIFPVGLLPFDLDGIFEQVLLTIQFLDSHFLTGHLPAVGAEFHHLGC